MTELQAALTDVVGGRYVVEGELARGGMSVVFAGRRIEDDRPVAIKVLREEFSTMADRSRFMREIEVEAGLEHENILPVLDWAGADALVYYVMPLVDGESLRDLLEREAPLPLERAVAIAAQIADGLQHAHDRGVIHRDVKPANVLLSGDRVWLTDFGIARSLEVREGHFVTSSGVVVGTPAYMSPEQAAGATELDPRSDVYALACVLFEALAGEPPFSGRTVQAIIARHVLERPPSVAVVRPDLPDEIVYAVEKGMAKTPADRFGTVSEFKEVMLGRRPVPSRPARRRARAKMAGLVAIAAVLLLLLVRPWAAEESLVDTRIVGFPFVPLTTNGVLDDGIGEVVALAVGSALEGAEPLRWIDGWRWMDADERSAIRNFTAERADEIMRERRARYRVEGQIVANADSVDLVMTLYDLAEEVEVLRRTERARISDEAIVSAAIDGTLALLSELLDPGQGQVGDRLGARDASAVTLMLFGNRELRSSRFESALEFYERALEHDPELVDASLRAATAASWIDLTARAADHARAAVERSDHLPPSRAAFARGLEAYLMGRADEALETLVVAAEAEPDWPDPHFAAAEVLRHLIPRMDSAAARAEVHYRAAVAADPEFTPALFHLAEAALWAGDTETATEHARTFREVRAQPLRVRQLELMSECAHGGRPDWRAEVQADATLVVEVAYSLLPAPRYADCVKGALRALLDSDSAERLLRSNAVLALQAVLMRELKGDSVAAVLTQAADAGLPIAFGLYVVDAALGAPTEDEATAFLDRLGSDYEGRGTQGLWLEAGWRARQGDLERLGLIADALARKAEAGADSENVERRNRLFAGVGELRVAILAGRPAEAASIYERLRPTARRADISWTMWESLGLSYLAYSEFLLEQGDFEEAERVAGRLDHPAPVMYRALEPMSLAVRLRAAEASGDVRAATRYRERMEELTR